MHASQRVLKKKKSPTKTIHKNHTARNAYNVNKKHEKTRERKTRNNDITKAVVNNAHNVDKHKRNKRTQAKNKKKQKTEKSRQHSLQCKQSVGNACYVNTCAQCVHEEDTMAKKVNATAEVEFKTLEDRLETLRGFREVAWEEFQKARSADNVKTAKELQSWMDKITELDKEIFEIDSKLLKERGEIGNFEEFWVNALEELKNIKERKEGKK